VNVTEQRPFEAYEPFIPDVDRFYESLHQPMLRYLRVNTLRITPRELTEMLKERNHRLRPSFLAPYLLQYDDPGPMPYTLEAALGYFFFQALTSAMATMALDPKPGELICDLCAAPGGKTTHMAQLMENQGLIVANDRREGRLRVLEHNIRRLGITNVITTQYTGQDFPSRWHFARVLADVPCSGEGRLRFGSSQTRPISRESNHAYTEIQRRLIMRAFDLLTHDGTLLYSTCTYNPDENEGVIQYLLESRSAELVPMVLSAPHAPGLLGWKDRTYDGQMARCWRIYPHQVNSVGFFLAKIRRRCAAERRARVF
jgi:NOL1/NOP2/sun family putative RNA methylase